MIDENTPLLFLLLIVIAVCCLIFVWQKMKTMENGIFLFQADAKRRLKELELRVASLQEEVKRLSGRTAGAEQPSEEVSASSEKVTETVVTPISSSAVAFSSPPPLPETSLTAPPLPPGHIPSNPAEKQGARHTTDAPPPLGKRGSFETFIGTNLFGKVGVLIFVVGIGFFVKYAIDNNWISEIMRIAMGVGTGVAMLGLAYWLRDKYRPFSSLLAGGGCAVFYMTVAIAFHYYSLLSQPVAFGLLVGVTSLMFTLSVGFNRRELSVVALVGGYLAPFVASSGTGNLPALLVYLAVLSTAMAVLAVRRRWGELPVCSFVFTGVILLLSVIEIEEAHKWMLLCAAAFFTLLMGATALLLLRGGTLRHWERLALAKVYLSSGFLFLLLVYLCETVQTAGWCSVCLAFVCLAAWYALKRKGEGETLPGQLSMALALAFATLAFPLFFGGALLCVCWVIEMVLLLWLYLKNPDKIFAVATVIMAVIASLHVGWEMLERTVLEISSVGEPLFLNADFPTWLVIGGAYVVFAVLMDRHREQVGRMYTPWNALMYMAGVLLLHYTVCFELYAKLAENINVTASQLFTATYFLLVSFLLRKRFGIPAWGALWGTLFALLALSDVCLLFASPSSATAPVAAWLRWGVSAVLAGSQVYLGFREYKESGKIRPWMGAFLCGAGTLVWIGILRTAFLQTGMSEFSVGLSLGLSLAAFVQMFIGLRLHRKELRLFSISLFVFVLVKLGLFDVWEMSKLGRILVFIALGLLLLILSFLYQKLKAVLLDEKESGLRNN